MSYAVGPMMGKTVNLLIDSTFICTQSHPDAYEYLLNDECFEAASDWISVLGRKICTTIDKRVFWAGFDNVEDANNLKAIKQQFSEVVNNLEVIVRWMELASSNSEDGKHLSTGQLVLEADMLAKISSSPSQEKRLRAIAHSKYIGVSTEDSTRMLKAIIAKFTQSGYFIPEGGAGLKHRATGKWAWLYSVMEYVANNEGLEDLEEDLGKGAQESLFNE